MRPVPLPLVLLLLLCAPAAWGKEHWMNPGTMGANALPSFPLEPPWMEPYTLVQLGGAAQYGKLGDVSMLPTFRLITPFGKWAEAIFEGAFVEAWWSSEQTRREWGLTRTQGVAKADIRFGFKVLLADAGEDLPKLAFRAITKSTTGKDLESRRFVDGPAYLLEVLLGQRIHAKHGVTIDVFSSVAYWIWQQQETGQNDAMHWAVSVQVQPVERLSLGVEARGYIGWQRNDKPVVVGLRAGVLITDVFELGATVNAGFVDAPRLEGRLDLRFRLPSLVPLLFARDPLP
ncbi:MAG: hypothetical protein Q8N23_05205 [Archangium sp.]|nr:hypothetical protein [Archangium sp.]MDP3152044.1 hypothetical protein [Archangium sp.]MDP3575470.1 hypothetical protein [Archangium sp.]